MSVKKLAVIIAIGAALFVTFTSSALAQPCTPPACPSSQGNQGFDEVSEALDAETKGSGGVLSQNNRPVESENGAPSTGARLGFTGWNESIFNILSSLGAMVAWLGGFLLDASIGIFTVGMYETSDKLGLDTAIQMMWGVVRDLFNLLFIFGLIWAGFKLILGDDSSKKMISSIVIAALLINFSLYVTQVVVDFTNVMAYQIHSLMVPESESEVLGWGEYGDISSSFTKLTNLDRLGDESQSVAENAGLTDDTVGSAIVLGLLFTIFYAILGFVFAAGGFILFSRFIALLLLMIFSPIMFLGSILPKFQQYSDQWKKLFLNQALVGPAFLFMLYLSLRTLDGLNEIEVAEYSVYSIIIYLMIVTAFLWASLMVAKSIGNWGSYQAYNVGNYLGAKARTAVGGATAGLAARGLRSTAGWGAMKIADNDRLRDAASGRGIKGWAARRAFNASSKVAGSTFDVRNVGGVGKKLGFGEGIKGSYKDSIDAMTKKEKEFAEKLGQATDEDPRVEALKLEADATEQGIKAKKKEVQDLRKKLNDKKLTEDERRETRALIEAARAEQEDMEEKHGDQKEAVQKEKQRRQLGFDNRVSSDIKDNLKTRKDKIKADQVEFARLNSIKEDKITDADKAKRENLRKAIADQKKELSEIEDEANKQAGGYAATVENQNIFRRWVVFRTKSMNKEVGKEIRTEYKKKVKSKDK